MTVYQGTILNEPHRTGWSVQRDLGEISYDNVKVDASATLEDGTPLSLNTSTNICVPYVADDSTHVFAGILYGRVIAASSQTRSARVTARLAELNGNYVVFPTDATLKAALLADFKAANLIVR